MKTLKFILALLLLAGCVQTIETEYPSVNSKGEYLIQFGTKGTRATVSSVSGTGYDEFNLYVWNSNNDTIMKPYRVEAFSPSDYVYSTLPNQELKYFSNAASYYDFTGVIPVNHKETVLGDTIKVDTVKAFTVDDARVSGTLIADSPEEFLWAYKRVNKVDYPNVVDLPFKHQNALIYIGFSSDRDDTELLDYVPGTPDIPAQPAVYDTTDIWMNLKRGSNCDGSPTRTSVNGGAYVDNYEIPAALVAEIKSYYSINNGTPGNYDLHMGNTAWPSAEIRQLRIVKDIPAAYRMPVETTGGDVIVFFDALKYLKDNGYNMTYRISGGKPDVFNLPIIDLFVNGSAYTIVGFMYSVSNVYDASVAGNIPSLAYTIELTQAAQPAIPGKQPIEGVRVFSADSVGVNNLPTDTLYCVHIPHTMIADAYIDSTGCKLDNRVVSDSVIQFSLPATTTLSPTPVWSATTFYGLPGDANFNFIVVKISYTYNGVTSYDVRVPIKLPAGGLQPGKYYKYEIKITSTYNGTNDPNEATNEKDEILIEGLHPIVVNLQITDYTQGANDQVII